MRRKGVKRLGLLVFFFAYGEQKEDIKFFSSNKDIDEPIYKEDKIIFEPHFDWAYYLLRFSRYQRLIRIGVMSFIFTRLIKMIRLLLRKKG